MGPSGYYDMDGGVSLGCDFTNSSGTNDTGNNSTTPCDEMHEDMFQDITILNDPKFIGIVVTLYSIVILVGALGNTLVVVTIVKTKQLWNATNIFIANLALADILVCVFDLPLNAYYQLTDDWVFGKALCHVIQPAFAVVVYASTLTLTMIAVDRFVLIIYPLKNRMSITIAMLLVVAIYVVSIAVALPIAIYASFTEVRYPEFHIHWRYCGEQWPHPDYARLYTVITLAVQFFIPLIVIAILYSFIFMKVKERMASAHSSRKTKTTKMLVAVVTIFAITWIPYHLFSLITAFNKDLVEGPYYKFADSMLRVLAMSSSCINPVLYGWLNDNYRNAFLSIIRIPTATPKGIKREDSDVTQNCSKGTPLGKFRVSPSKGRNGHSNTKATKVDHSSEESVPLNIVNNNAREVDETTNTPTTNTNTPTVTVKDIQQNINGNSSSQSSLLKA